MNCSFKTMAKVAAGLGLIATAAYFALPGAQAWLVASAPILLALVCPISMLLMMFMMKGKGSAGASKAERPHPAEASAHAPSHDGAPEKA